MKSKIMFYHRKEDKIMESFKEMANKAANDYVRAITAAYTLKGVDNDKQIDTLIDAINRMYQNQTLLINEIALPEEENEVEIQIPDFMLRRRVG